jgi:hypothetical protein
MNALYTNLKQYPEPPIITPGFQNMISTVVKLSNIESSLLENEPRIDVGCKEGTQSLYTPKEADLITDKRGAFVDMETFSSKNGILGFELISNPMSSIKPLADSYPFSCGRQDSVSREITGIVSFIGGLCDFCEGEKEDVWSNYGNMIKTHGYSIGSMHLLDITKLNMIGITLPGHVDRYSYILYF